MAIEAIAMEGPEARVSDHVARLIATCSRGWERFFGLCRKFCSGGHEGAVALVCGGDYAARE
jgi:hypothetical protein